MPPLQNLPLRLGLSSGTDHKSGLELPAQIYYRNIEDRYPSLPPFLTRRLAIANLNRAERLQEQLKTGTSAFNSVLTGDLALPKQLENPNPWPSWVEIMEPLRSEDPRNLLPISQPKSMLDEVPPNSTQEFGSKMFGEVKEAQVSTSRQEFWTTRRSSDRPSSVFSNSSSRNSSLHGSAVMDSSYQRPIFFKNQDEHETQAASSPNRGLFPAPTERFSLDHERKEFCFHCEICGKIVEVNRRRDWQ